MNISFLTGCNLHSSNLNINTNSTKKDDDIKTKDKSKKRSTINSSNTSLGGKSKKIVFWKA